MYTTAVAQDLPQELLGEIFVQCLPRNSFDHFQPNPGLPPMVLCHVCSSWRKAALGTPQLWTELSMRLGYVSHRSTSGFPPGRLNTLEFWSSHMGALLPSLHFQRERSCWFACREHLYELAPFTSFFQYPAISNAQSITLDAFSETDLLKISTLAGFNNIEYLAITGPDNREYSTLLKFPPYPSLRRLSIDFHTWRIDPPSRFETAFSWVTITHLSANLRLGRQDWRATLHQCVNMTSCSVVLHFLEELTDTNSTYQKAAITFHHNLRTFSVRADTVALSFVFDGFVFPSLLALRLSCLYSTARIRDIHQAIAATPALKEFHLHFCVRFSATNFLKYWQLAGPLSKFAPGLAILVFDHITFDVEDRTEDRTKDILTLLHSNWLNDGWATRERTPMNVEIIVDEIPYSISLSHINREIDNCRPLPFHPSARIVKGGLWDWQELNARELRDHWDDNLAFSMK